MRLSRLAAVIAGCLAPTITLAQVTPGDTARPPRPLDFPLPFRLHRDSLTLGAPAAMLPFGRLAPVQERPEYVARQQAELLQRLISAQRSALWGQTTAGAFAGVSPGALLPPDSTRRPGIIAQTPRDTFPRRKPGAPTDIFGQYADLGLQLASRLELKAERDKNERCVASDALNPINNCRGSFQPQFDFQFGVRTGGIVADRVHVNVDYDSQREFDASNNISVFYQGRSDEILQRLEVGNVSFAPPSSRFITNGIPSGNYGLQAIGQLGPMSFRTIVAQQKGNVVKDRIYTVGDRTVQAVDAEIEDNRFERRRFFFVVDPARAFPTYPNIDLLDPNLRGLATLADSLRPRRVLVYRYRPPSFTGSASSNINGPHAIARYARNRNEIGPYEILQQGVDYYLDPSNLWIALVSPINRGERLAVSYTVTINGQEVTRPDIGGTFPQQRNPSATDLINLLWDNEVLPGDSAFNREIRGVYRLGGDDIQRNTITAKIVIGTGSDQEKPAGPNNGRLFDTFLQLFGLSQRTNSSTFDVENRLWPRLGDPNQAAGAGGSNSKLIKDYFIIFPSVRPFADSGLVHLPNPVNDSLYRTPDEDLVSQRRPPTQYRIRARYSAEGGGETGSLSLGTVQVRPNSERILVDGRPLARDVDYRVDYELGRVTFLHPDTLFQRPRPVNVQYEENPLFAAAPTSIFGIATSFPFQNGQLNFTAISQSQKTTFNRPPLGFEPASSLIAGVNGVFNFESSLLTSAINRLPFVQTSIPSSITVQGEFATSRPQPNAAGAAYVESFEGEGGLSLPLQESNWRYGSRPATPNFLFNRLAYDFPLDSASTLAWQNTGETCDPLTNTCQPAAFLPQQIDSAFVFTGGNGIQLPESILWLTLYPRTVGGLLYNPYPTHFQWRTPAGSGRHWRSITQALSPSGIDLSRVEQLEFYVLLDTTLAGRRANPTLLFDFGDISESSVYFGPTNLTVQQGVTTDPSKGGATVNYEDSVFTGRKQLGADRIVSERDSLTNSFDAATNDKGLPGDVVDQLEVRNVIKGTDATLANAPICRGGLTQLQILGDTKNNCTVLNRRLDENDLDLDRALNLTAAQRNDERLLRYQIDLSNAQAFNRVGRCYRRAGDTTTTTDPSRPVCWVRVRVPFGAPTDSINQPLRRRIKAMRLTLVSSPFASDTDFARVGVARLKLTGSPWVKRSDRAIAGVGGTKPGGNGYVIAGIIGTQDRDSLSGIFYESPPGVTDQADTKQSQFAAGTQQINERSLRLVAGDLPLFHRAEAFYRFPEGDKNFLGYQELRVWARGRGKGWGPNGDLQFYIKVGRDQDNFYLYRVAANEGPSRDAWLPEVVVDFHRFFTLRAQLQNNYLRNGTQIACTGLDSMLVARSEVSTESGVKRYAACDGGYIVYTSNPGVSAPNLAAVQELAVGILRADTLGQGGSGRISPNDSLEVWVDDIRLTGVVDNPGYAGQVGLNIAAGDVGSIAVNMSRRDASFRQLAEQPSYLTDDQLGISSSLRLEKFLPQSLGLALPMSVSYSSSGSDPFFLSRTDIQAGGIQGLRTPRSTATSYALSVRRASPLDNPLAGLLFNNLSVNTTYSTSTGRSEYSIGNSKSFTGNLDYNLVSAARTRRLPAWLDGLIMHLPGFLLETDPVRQLRTSAFRWNPTQFRFTSAFAQNTDHRTSFGLPIAIDSGDRPQQVTGLSRLWRNASQLELRPFSSTSVHWDIASLRDLRTYSDSTATGVLARQERDKLFGRFDAGLERERQMNVSASVAPVISTWIRPRFDFSTSYSMLRDPNAQALLRTADSAYRLPRRLSNSQGVGANATFDLGRGLVAHSGDSSILRRMSNSLQPLEVTWRRDLRSTFDGVPFTPGLSYQLPFGGVNRFREVNGVLATGAGISRLLSFSHAVSLPLGFSVTNRYEKAASTSWTRITDSQSLLQSDRRIFPDLSLRWTFRPRFLSRAISSLGAQVGSRTINETSFQPTIGSGTNTSGSSLGEGIRTSQTTRQLPINGSIAWLILGGFSTSGGLNKVNTSELRSGGVTLTKRADATMDIGKPFHLPKSWNLKSDVLRARIGMNQSHSQGFFLTSDSTASKRVTDNGRFAINGNADADINDNMSFSFTLSRVLNYDNNYDRKFTQTVLSAVLHLQFFAGEIK